MAEAGNRRESNDTRQQDLDAHSREGAQADGDTVEQNPGGYGFRVSELQSAETQLIGGREDTSEHLQAGVRSRASQAPDSLRRRHIGVSTGGLSVEPGPGVPGVPGGVEGQETAALSREALRAARLQRLAGGAGQQGSRVPLNSINTTLRNSPLNKK